MIVIWQNSEARLKETAHTLRSAADQHYVIFFHLSGLQEHYRSEFQLRIASNVLNDVFVEAEGYIFNLLSGDIVVLYRGAEKSLIDKALFQVRYLFIDDPLANSEDGSENRAFADVFDLEFQWHDFNQKVNEKMGGAAKKEQQSAPKRLATTPTKPLTPDTLVYVQKELASLDLGLAFRNQPICIVKKSNLAVTVMFHEMYTHISHLKKLLPRPVELTSNRWLFRYVTEILDKQVMAYLEKRSNILLQRPVSINLNVDSILSQDFTYFHEALKKKNDRFSIVIEIQVGDVFIDMAAFLAAKDKAHELGYRVCLDGLTTKNIHYIDREKLGFDLAKLIWNADIKDMISTKENTELQEAMKVCGVNRMILCRCDTMEAIEYGHALGISLFQGRYPDMMLNPDATIQN